MLNFPNAPVDGDLSSQPNGVTYQWSATNERWTSVGSLDGNNAVVAVGAIFPFAAAPQDATWLRCNGQAVSRDAYKHLFNFIGVMYGNGDGSTTFNLPDYRGTFLRDVDDGAAVDPDAATRTDRGDGVTGDEVGTKQADEFESHSHTMNVDASTAASGGSARAGVLANTTGLTGGNETRPVNTYALHYIYSGLNLTVAPTPNVLYTEGVFDGVNRLDMLSPLLVSVKRIIIGFDDVRQADSSNMRIRCSLAGVEYTSDYQTVCARTRIDGVANSGDSAGGHFIVTVTSTAALLNGSVTLDRVSDNKWSCNGLLVRYETSEFVQSIAGMWNNPGNGEIDGFAVGGSGQNNSGTLRVRWEG